MPIAKADAMSGMLTWGSEWGLMEDPFVDRAGAFGHLSTKGCLRMTVKTTGMGANFAGILISNAFAGIVMYMQRMRMTACCLSLRAEAAVCATEV